MPQRLRTLVGLPLRGISASFSRAIRRSVSSLDSSSAIAFSRAYLPAYFLTSFLRRSFLLIELSFAMDLSSLLSCSLSRLRERANRLRGLFGLLLLREREVEEPEQFARLLVRLRGGGDDDVHAAHLLDAVIVDLGEHDLLLETHREIAAAVERLGVQAPESADAGKRDRDQAVEELV